MSVWAHHDDRNQTVGGRGEPTRRLSNSLLVVEEEAADHVSS